MEKLADASQPAVLLNETRYAKANFVPVPQSNGPEPSGGGGLSLWVAQRFRRCE